MTAFDRYFNEQMQSPTFAEAYHKEREEIEKDTPMKITLEFKSYEDAKPHLDGLAYLGALLELDKRLRDAAKYEDDEHAQKWRDIFYDVLSEYNLSLYE